MKAKAGLFALFYLFPFITTSQEDTTQKINTLLNFSMEELMKVEVVSASASVSGQKLSDAPSTMYVITSQQIEERGYEELGDALRDIPGIDFNHLNGYSPTLIYFRGMYGAENLRALLMIDGIPENNIAGTNNIAGPSYSLHHVERIEIIWGPASALYGANAFGGLINIITKKAETVNGLKIQRGQGNLNTSFEKAVYGIKKGAFDVSFSGSLFRTEGPRFTNRAPNYSASYVDNAYSFLSSIGYTSAKCKTQIGYRTFVTPMGWGQILNTPTQFFGLLSSGYENKGTVGVVAENFNGEKPSRNEPFSRTSYLQNTYTFNTKWSLFTLAEFRENGISERSYCYITVNGKDMYRLPSARYSNRWGGKVGASYVINPAHHISGGMEFYQDNLEDGSRKLNFDTANVYLINGQFKVRGIYSTFKKRSFIIWNNFGSFLQYELHTKCLRETYFTIGTRYDINSVYGNPLSPRIAIVNRPNEKLTIKLLYGTAYRAPTIMEVEEFRSNLGTRNSLANSDLKPEKVRTYEFNVIYNPVKELLFQLNTFRNELADIIVLTTLQTGGYTQNQNLGEAYVNGVELKADAAFSKKISAFVNFTFQEGEQTARRFAQADTTFKIPNIAVMKANAGVTVYLPELLTINLIGNWVGVRQVLGYNPYGNVPGYLITNCAFTSRKFSDNRIFVSLTIKNLFNVKYLDPGIRSADGLLYSTVLEQPGITGIFKITVSL